jgi:ferredoxin
LDSESEHLLGFHLENGDKPVTLVSVKIVIDADRCQGHNRCYAIAPQLIDVDELGTAFVIGDGTVAPELAEKARLAVANCPERAISLVD